MQHSVHYSLEEASALLSEVAELVTESYRLCAPQKLARRLDAR